ncbi:hypothetical protein J3F84DRAFT_351696 [Trichoderma pleuroticola]
MLSKITLEFVTKEIGAAMCALMMEPTEDLDTTMTLTSMGVDSLVSKFATGGAEA